MSVEDSRGFWARVADAEYGVADDRGVNPDVFFGGIGGWQPGAGNIRFQKPEEAIGYFRFNTGNETRDAIFSIAANELGLDNFVRAVQHLDNRNYWGAAREGVMAGVSLATFGVMPVLGAAGRARSLYNIARATRAAPATTTTVSRAGPSTFTSALNPGALASGNYGYSTPLAYNTANVPFAQRLGQAVRGASRPPIPPAAADAGIIQRGIRLARVAGRRIGAPLAVLGTPAWLYMASQQDAAPTAAEAQAALDAAENPQLPAGPPPNFVPPDGSNAAAEAAAAARINVAAINRQYENILRELQDAYQLSETDEERERIRFMLADIEAQRDAGLQAISDGYAQTVAAIQQRATLAREGTAQRAQDYGAELEKFADRAAQRMILQNLQQQEQFRGLGAGSQDATNEWIGLMSAMAPLQQQYTQRMGDISAEGIDWMADTVGAQGQAQQADLQRLAAATRSAAIMQHQNQVTNRIERERQMQRDAMMQIMMQQASAVQSANQFNASLAAQFAVPQYGMGDISSLAWGDPSEGGLPGLPPEGIETFIGRRLTPQELSMAQARYQQGLIARGQQAVTAGSRSPATQIPE